MKKQMSLVALAFIVAGLFIIDDQVVHGQSSQFTLVQTTTHADYNDSLNGDSKADYNSATAPYPQQPFTCTTYSEMTGPVSGQNEEDTEDASITYTFTVQGPMISGTSNANATLAFTTTEDIHEGGDAYDDTSGEESFKSSTPNFTPGAGTLLSESGARGFGSYAITLPDTQGSVTTLETNYHNDVTMIPIQVICSVTFANVAGTTYSQGVARFECQNNTSANLIDITYPAQSNGFEAASSETFYPYTLNSGSF